jgi:hypothetical protein
MNTTSPHLLAWFIAIVLFSMPRPAAAMVISREEAPEVQVLLWFDTEDFLLPAADDAVQRLAETLTAKGIRATFKIVGEKARVLEKRGRQDVIAALKRHDIAYHANLHSVHPTPAEYLAECGFLDGIAEFIRREGAGAADVRRIFGVPTLSCYGQPGSSWAPQAIAALKSIGVAVDGIPCYVDEGTHVGLSGQPFWYVGALTVYHMAPNYTRMDLHDPTAVEPAKREVQAIAERLRQQSKGGLISIFYHPCEWVHREFWDGVNFRRGANPPREQWQAPPQRPPAETEQAFRRFSEYMDFIRSLPRVRFVTASELPELYPDLIRKQGATAAELDALARTLTAKETGGIDFKVVGHKAFSPADQFELLTSAVNALATHQPPTYPLIATGILGPDHLPGRTVTLTDAVAWPAFRDAVGDAHDYVQTQHRIPSRIYLGAQAITPADFLVGLARVYQHQATNGFGDMPAGVRIGHGLRLETARYVAQDTPDLFGGWVIHPEGFRAPQILEVARLQAWTLKPAMPRSEK